MKSRPTSVGFDGHKERTHMTANRTSRIGFSVLAALALIGGAAFAGAKSQEKAMKQPEPKCKINPVEAIKIAHTKVKGTVIQSNFEFDEGKWVYGVMIVEGKTIKEVEIDPITGKIGDIETVTPEDEAKEIKDALTKAIGGTPEKMNPAEIEKDEEDEKPAKKP